MPDRWQCRYNCGGRIFAAAADLPMAADYDDGRQIRRRRRYRFQLGHMVIFTVIPTPPTGIPAFRLPQPSFRHSGSPNRHSGASRNLLFRHSDFSIIPPVFRHPAGFPPFRRFSVIPAKAGIYFSAIPPVFRHSAGFPPFRRKPESTFPPFRFFRHPAGFPPFRRFSRHSGESRNLRVAMDSGFRRSDGSTPKPPERKHCRSNGMNSATRRRGSSTKPPKRNAAPNG